MLRVATIVSLGVVLLVPLSLVAADGPELPLVFQDDFEKGAGNWKPTDPEAWRIVETDRGKVYSQFKTSKYQPPHRSPHNISLVKGVSVGDFVLTVKVQSTNPGAGAHQDMCLFFNYRDPAHFYYVHLGKRPDPHSSQIMIVNGAPRVMITKNESPGIPWDDKWHDVKIVRRTADGTIEIYFDDMKKPVMTAVDKTFTSGQVGIGSFDDKGNWDDFKLRGVKVKKEPAMTAEANLSRVLAERGLELPDPPEAKGMYKPLVICGNLAYTSGHLPIEPDGTIVTGRVGESLDQEAGRRAAMLAGLGILATLRSELKSLDRVGRLVKLLGFVNCTPDFEAQPAVLNGASELFAEVFGRETGIGARSAVAAPSLPLGVPVEIEGVFHVPRV